MKKSIVLKGLMAALVVVVSGSLSFAAPLKVDVNLSDYIKVQGVAGNLNSIGSDTLNNMMTGTR